jgi:O-antigen/teichoic acid export membrane protein
VGEFRAIAKTRISQGLSGPVSQILLGILGSGTSGLAIGFIIGQSSGTYLLFSRVVLRSSGLVAQISWHGLFDVVRRYVQFPLFAAWARLLDMAGSGPVLFILFSACYSPVVAGYMFLTERVIARPLYMVSTSLLQVFTGEAGLAVRDDPARMDRRFRQVVLWQFLASAGWIVLANIVATWTFPLVFGQQWVAAIPYLRATSIGYLALAVLHPVSTAPQILERQLLATVWQAGRLILIVSSVMLAWRIGASAVLALWLSSLVQAVFCAAMLALIAHSIRRVQRA